MRARMVELGRSEVISRFSIENMVNGYGRAYSSLILPNRRLTT